ncbi:hypothetical protein H312_01024 [Anncaliia algerae PRA339]|uniref:Uncharacterized protein n=1 Tax=Anncaliia algerae PRA339 TaxID=1288291 RepID=A0A059F327_9MICR|nr:hypothetical protein H312_01024 [Anncaliia algerae PRA339]
MGIVLDEYLNHFLNVLLDSLYNSISILALLSFCLGSEKKEVSNFVKDNHPNMPKWDRKISESERILQIFSSLKKEFVKAKVLHLQFYVTDKESYALSQNDDISYEEKHILLPDIISVENVKQVANFLSINIDKIQSIADDLYELPDIKKLLEDLKYSSQLFKDFYEEYTKLRENKYSSQKNLILSKKVHICIKSIFGFEYTN